MWIVLYTGSGAPPQWVDKGGGEFRCEVKNAYLVGDCQADQPPAGYTGPPPKDDTTPPPDPTPEPPAQIKPPDWQGELPAYLASAEGQEFLNLLYNIDHWHWPFDPHNPADCPGKTAWQASRGNPGSPLGQWFASHQLLIQDDVFHRNTGTNEYTDWESWGSQNYIIGLEGKKVKGPKQ